MANTKRKPGLKGRNSRRLPREVPLAENYLTDRHVFGMPGQLPEVPAGLDIDFCSKVSDWPMFLNDKEGDCTIAGAAHFFMAMCAYSGQPVPSFTSAEVNKAYSAVSGYNPSTGANDNGADMLSVLMYLRDTGMTDTTGKVHKVAAFAALSRATDTDLATRVLSAFGTLYIGINCQQATEEQFAGRHVLDWVPGSPDLGGHALVIQRRQPGVSGIFWPITWGADCQATAAWYTGSTEEAWAVASEDFIAANGTSLQGFSLEQLVEDTKVLGRPVSG